MVFNKIKHIKCKIKHSTFILVVSTSPLFARIATSTAIYTAFTRLCDGEHYCLRWDNFSSWKRILLYVNVRDINSTK